MPQSSLNQCPRLMCELISNVHPCMISGRLRHFWGFWNYLGGRGGADSEGITCLKWNAWSFWVRTVILCPCGHRIDSYFFTFSTVIPPSPYTSNRIQLQILCSCAPYCWERQLSLKKKKEAALKANQFTLVAVMWPNMKKHREKTEKPYWNKYLHVTWVFIRLCLEFKQQWDKEYAAPRDQWPKNASTQTKAFKSSLLREFPYSRGLFCVDGIALEEKQATLSLSDPGFIKRSSFLTSIIITSNNTLYLYSSYLNKVCYKTHGDKNNTEQNTRQIIRWKSLL